MSSDDFLKLFKNKKLAAEAFGHWKNKDWSKLEDLFRKNGINDGWPPNRGFVQSKTTTLNPGKQIDRYGGRTNPLTGNLKMEVVLSQTKERILVIEDYRQVMKMGKT